MVGVRSCSPSAVSTRCHHTPRPSSYRFAIRRLCRKINLVQNRIQFAYVDVFADQPLTGNPLVVVPDADALTVGQMRAIAREFNQSETTFIVQPSHPDAQWRLRSYTPAGVEVGGAGHNALGAWLWLAENGVAGSGSRRLLTQEIDGDLLPVEIRETAARVQVVMEQSAPRFGAKVADVSALGQALGIGADDFADESASQVVSTGVAHLLVGLNSREAVDGVTVNPPALKEILRQAAAEDPATGTAAGPLAALLARADPALRHEEIVIHQGHAVGRPSRLRFRVLGDRVFLTGSGLVVGEGWLRV